jgi:4-phospho-D-threonate 3-dehydrogenase / 4-phospho-D-erythronate 3-dehydrogenase
VPRLPVIADDLSGAADCAIACTGAGLTATVALGELEEDLTTEVLSIDCDSRHLTSEAAADNVSRLVEQYASDREILLFKKLDSTLRGNVAAELAAILKARRRSSSISQRIVAVMAPAFPASGRTTVNGQQLVHGRPLHESETWKNERSSIPMNISSLVACAGMEPVLLGLDDVRSGKEALRQTMSKLASAADVLVCDAETEDDLRAITAASLVLGRETIWAGSAGLAYHLPHVAGLSFTMSTEEPLKIANGPTLFVIGSMSSVSQKQIRKLETASTITMVALSPQVLLTGPQSSLCAEYTLELTRLLQTGRDVLVSLAMDRPLDHGKSRALSKALGAMLAPLSCTIGALVASGGETARAILDALDVKSLRVIEEIEPGLPFSVTKRWSRQLPILTKAGAFGDPHTLLRCWQFLQTLDRGTAKMTFASRTPVTNRPIIAMTMGDAAGVGPEIIMKTLTHPELYDLCRPLVIGDSLRLQEAGRIVGAELQVRSLSPDRASNALYRQGSVDCIALKLIPQDLPWGKLSAVAGDAAFRYMEVAAELAVTGKVQAICTAPLNKEALHAGGHKYPGHTEILAALTGTEEVSMMLSTPKMRVIHVTTHIGLIDAIVKIEPVLVERTISRGVVALQKAGITNPRIGVCGINPHAGENGLFGRGEEAEKIEPAIRASRAKEWNVEGPLPADTLFFRAQRGDFDLVVAMYHDQGHGPVKVLGLESGVNITIGLPVVRTSVDHGTAFDIAGTGKADESSMVQAMLQAIQLASTEEGIQTK